jgi:two-component system CheB/CheR fusion protein
MSIDRSLPQLVVIGSSAGGIEALATLVATLSIPFPAPLIIAQHLDPSRPSHLGDILTRHTPLPVVTVQQQEPLQAGTIYVVPANHHVEVTDHDITLLLDGGGRPKPSIDLLLRSAAAIYGERLVAVILTGTGSDGASGARAVKQAGGTVVIQNPATAAYPGMPQAVAPQIVDIVAELPRIGPILFDLLAGGAVPPPADAERALAPFLGQVQEHTGLDFRAYKTPTIRRRLQRRIVATATGDLAGYQRYLEQHPDEYGRLTSSFLIKVTDFMRDPELFASLRDTVLPELIAASRERSNEVRCWSAGCATGEEAYSLAILLLEALGPEYAPVAVKIFATDLDSDALAFARRGLYPPDALRRLPPALVARYFTAVEGGYAVTKPVRSLVVFGEHNLAQRAPFPRIDLVLCRNVLIYFTRELQQRALQLFAYALREGGYLALGKTETVSPTPDFFVPVLPQQKLYRRQGQVRPTPPFQTHSYALPPPGSRAAPRPPKEAAHTGFPATQDVLQSRAAQDNLLLNLPIGVVVVDRRYDIQEINSAARRLLGIHTVAIGEDLVHLAHQIANQPFRAALDQALREHTPATLAEVALPQLTTGAPSYLQIDCYPQPGPAGGSGGGLEDRVLVLVSDITAQVQTRRQLERTGTELARSVEDLRAANAALTAGNEETRQTNAALDEARHTAETEAARHAQQSTMLVDANRELLAANEELTRTNHALRARLDDFVQTSAEAQAATEEAETLNEEMQATNEELETLNEELQATVEELHTSNTDLAARGDELQSLAASLETQQQQITRDKAQLEAILTSLADAVLVVRPDGTPRLSNAAYQQMFGGDAAGGPVGGDPAVLADEHGQPLPPGATPQARAARGETFRMTFTLTKPAEAERCWLEALGQPVHGDDGHEWGVVVIRDITERSLRLLQEEFMALAAHELRTPLTAISGYLQLLGRQLQEPAGHERALQSITRARTQVTRLMRLITDLLDVARLQHGKFRLEREPVRLDTLLRGVVEIGQTLAPGPPITLTVGVEGDGEGGEPGRPLWIQGDPARLEQVLLNLLINARLYAPASPRIDVRLTRVTDQAEIAVQDYGPGIAPDQLAALFERFYQGSADRSPAGLGLGLFISRQLVTAHDGTITVTSTEGGGTTFRIRLPLVEPPRDAPG